MTRPALLFCLALPAAGFAVDFNRDVRPVLAQHCFKCHGMDDQGRKGKLRLDLREAAIGQGKSGELAIVPGKPDASEVIKRVFSTDEDELMPPPHTKTVLPESAKNILKAWIAEGANYEAHWAYMPPKQAALPMPGMHPIDSFIQSRLKQEGLKPSAEADKYTLVRRVFLDLTGLPPTPAEADAFVNDQSADAYDKLVDALLASKQYGERWARRWLDLARYADTNGFEKDRPRPIWPYRDWVVRALNEDMPFDQFSIKQLAGDMLPKATPDDLIATGFHRNTMLNEEGGIDPNEYRFYAMVDRVGVTGTAWMGLTMNCCQCHTHKYDPILHTDYYRTMALLNNADEPTYFIPTPEVAAQQKAQDAKVAKLEAELPGKYPGGKTAMESRFAGWVEGESRRASKWEVIKPTKMETTMPHLEQQADGFILGSGDISKSDVYDLSFKAPIKGVRALRIEVTSHPSLPNNGPGLTNYEGPIGGFFMSEFQASQGGKRVQVARAEDTNEDEDDKINDSPATPAKGKAKAAAKAKKKNNAQATLDGEMSSGWQVLGGYGVQHAAVFHFEQPVDLTNGLDLKLLFEKHFACPLGHFRISVTTSDHAEAMGYPAEVEEALASGEKGKHELLLRTFLENAEEMKQAAAPLLAARKNPARGQATLVMQERPASNPRSTHRYHRGEYLQPKEEVTPAVPAFLPPLPKGEAANRLTFAKWLFAPENPLTARVTVNRQWQAFFGRGIVKSLEDFGYQSDPPSHPELLDWLAVELVKQGWSMKKLHRLIVTSATYKQGSRITPELAQKDAENVLLARGPRFRLEAEIIRDSALKAAGVLSLKMGGPGVYPPQPASVTSEGTYGKVEWKVSEGEDHFRRSLYTFTKRTAPFAMATTFDAPTGESCLAKREVSNSPLQALTLLNDQMFMEAAQAMAKQVIAESRTDDERLQNIIRRAVTRPAVPEELAMFKSFLSKQRERKVAEESLWADVSRAALNLDEAITHP
ncbi:PSD1 and planctomycete cytochrome C domain-containing protein [Prosthecobacter fluviatilis]|uniref:PSD1 and planctomycete cytochrome C domain-containing protein n=1 Tax=Prosthecobacter fluviatilis TaxID=445931 RepID=A0ABW0KU53_9BACT